MEPASSNPPTEPLVTQPQEVPAVSPVAPAPEPVTPVPSVPPVAPTPEIPATPEKPGGSKTMVIVAIALLVVAVLAALAYFLGFLSLGGAKSPTPTQVAVPLITPVESPIATESAAPVASPSASTQGTVSGKLCYPAGVAPAGQIIAKDTTSGKTYTQNFAGTAAGGTLSYTFPLVPGTYHLKYQTAPTMAGYFTPCAKDPTSTTCAQDTNHVNLGVVVASGKTVAGVDLCDFYWNQTQKSALDASF